MDSAQIGVVKKRDEICFNRLLKCANSRGLKAEVCSEVMRNLTDEALERQPADQKLRRFLVPTDLTKSHSSRLVSVGLLNTAGTGCDFSSSLGSKILPRGFDSSPVICPVSLIIM
jgi:hypothetical protein